DLLGHRPLHRGHARLQDGGTHPGEARRIRLRGGRRGVPGASRGLHRDRPEPQRRAPHQGGEPGRVDRLQHLQLRRPSGADLEASLQDQRQRADVGLRGRHPDRADGLPARFPLRSGSRPVRHWTARRRQERRLEEAGGAGRGLFPRWKHRLRGEEARGPGRGSEAVHRAARDDPRPPVRGTSVAARSPREPRRGLYGPARREARGGRNREAHDGEPAHRRALDRARDDRGPAERLRQDAGHYERHRRLFGLRDASRREPRGPRLRGPDEEDGAQPAAPTALRDRHLPPHRPRHEAGAVPHGRGIRRCGRKARRHAGSQPRLGRPREHAQPRGDPGPRALDGPSPQGGV
ncbi:MAG: hypothetical protein AVDCRST_MAG25-955, partial [uncultured Rubrobacteraceae bacterium]